MMRGADTANTVKVCMWNHRSMDDLDNEYKVGLNTVTSWVRLI